VIAGESKMNVGELRELLIDLSDETPIVVPDQAYEEFFPGSASIKVLHYSRVSEVYRTTELPGATIPTVPVRVLILG
jgi:hypothetical protein